VHGKHSWLSNCKAFGISFLYACQKETLKKKVEKKKVCEVATWMDNIVNAFITGIFFCKRGPSFF